MNTALDLTPLTRSIIGFDRFSDLIDKAFSPEAKFPSYPPYNIEKLDDTNYAIVMAVAGFGAEDLQIVNQGNTLKVSAKISEEKEDKNKNYLYRGIATRSFERTFSLDDHMKVKGAEVKDGLLRVELEREIPEEAKPKVIEIRNGNGSSRKAIENKKS